MSMTDIADIEEILTKSGAELFKELYRIYPVADPEDYFKVGAWRNDMMKCDLRLVEMHRRESGAPDVPDLEDIKMPPMPQEAKAFAGFNGIPGLFTGAGVVKPAGVNPLTAGVGPVAGSTSVVEIRLIALFVAKWKLDPATSKQKLSVLTAVHRRYVIQNFKTTVTGAEASVELDEYITKCEEDKTWDTPAAAGSNGGSGLVVAPATMRVSPAVAAAKAAVVRPPVAVGGTLVSPAASGLKRPLMPAATIVNPAWQMNKRPALGGAVGPGIVRPPGQMVRPQMVRPAFGMQKGGW